MLKKEMTLNEMINFAVTDKDMEELPLEAVVYIKICIISLSRENNYDFIRYIFADSEINDIMNNANDTIFYDFDGTETARERYISFFEITSKVKYSELSIYLEELINNYTHEADVIIDMYTHDSKVYRLSNLYGIVKLEEMKNGKQAID